MRLLPGRPNHDRGGAAAGETESNRRRHRSANGWESLPMRDLHAHSRRDSSRRRTRGPGRWQVKTEKRTQPRGARSSNNLDRRSFLKSSLLAGGGLVLGFYASKNSALAAEVGQLTAATLKDFSPSAFLRISPEGVVTIIAH